METDVEGLIVWDARGDCEELYVFTDTDGFAEYVATEPEAL